MPWFQSVQYTTNRIESLTSGLFRKYAKTKRSFPWDCQTPAWGSCKYGKERKKQHSPFWNDSGILNNPGIVPKQRLTHKLRHYRNRQQKNTIGFSKFVKYNGHKTGTRTAGRSGRITARCAASTAACRVTSSIPSGAYTSFEINRLVIATNHVSAAT